MEKVIYLVAIPFTKIQRSCFWVPASAIVRWSILEYRNRDPSIGQAAMTTESKHTPTTTRKMPPGRIMKAGMANMRIQDSWRKSQVCKIMSRTPFTDGYVSAILPVVRKGSIAHGKYGNVVKRSHKSRMKSQIGVSRETPVIVLARISF